MTFADDWALKTNYLSIHYLSLFHDSVKSDRLLQNEVPEMQEALSFAQDVVVGKYVCFVL